jgi:hypothetical protein
MESFNQNILKYQDLLVESEQKKLTKKRIVELRKSILVLCKGAVLARKELSEKSKALTRSRKKSKPQE